ncbi:MAG: polysaccharide biosynthesis protein, partial [Candidatus Limnocylindria bacterium]
MLIDLLAVAATYLLAVTVRTGARFDIPNVGGAIALALAAGVAQVIANWAFHVYRRDWSVAGLEDLVALAKATGVVVVALLAFNVVSADHYLPFGAVLSGGAAVLIVEGALRLRARWPQAVRAILARPDGRATAIVVGAGTTGQLLARHLAGRADGYGIACFVDDDPKKRGYYVRGIPVQGTVEELPALIERHGASLVVIATAHPSGELARRVVERCEGSDVRVRAVSGFGLPEGDMSPLRSIGIEELLAREPVDLDTEEARALVRGRSVLVTGAAGSIGSELCRRISRLEAKRMILLDTNENGLHEVGLDLGGDVPREVLLGDIRDRRWLDRTLRDLRPDLVFHAAAYKHVPIIERQPLAGIATNALGTANVVEAALAAGVEHLVFVSSDKAVAPVSVLGLTKRFGELLTIAAGREAGLPWTAVRFGNVLGSSGSVVPLFARQLDRGGPVTLTDPDAMRYFMTIPEAAGLLVEGAAIARPGDLLVLEMGAPVPIAELARKMIRLRGLRVSDVEISEIGLRPGEKLTEQLLFPDEEVEGTAHPEVLRAASRAAAPTLVSLRATVAALEERVAAADAAGAVALLRSAVGTP